MTVTKSPLTLTFRSSTAEDIPVLLPLIRSAYRGEESRAGWTTEADLVADDRIDASGLLLKIKAPDSIVLHVTDQAAPLKPLACCEVVWHEATQMAYFGLFAVDPHRQGGGVGRQVLEYAEEYARKRWGAKKMEMTVIAVRSDIIAWYGRRGYQRTGEKRPFPYAELVNGKALRDDLYFDVLVKEFVQ